MYIFATNPSERFCLHVHTARATTINRFGVCSLLRQVRLKTTHGWNSAREIWIRSPHQKKKTRTKSRRIKEHCLTTSCKRGNQPKSMTFIFQQIYAFEQLSMAFFAAIETTSIVSPKKKFFLLCVPTFFLLLFVPFFKYWWLFYYFMCH